MQTYTVQTTTSLKAFLFNLIDYAGLFPPAKLPLDEAIQDYAAYRESDQNWMLSRFIVPASRLAELCALAGDLFSKATTPFRFSILGQGEADQDAFLQTLTRDLQVLAAFRRCLNTGIVADMFEVPLPASALANRATAWTLLTALHEHLSAVGNLRAFYEVPAGPTWSKMMFTLVDLLAEFNLIHKTDYGLKVRCGGVKPADFPLSVDVTMALLQCRDRNVALKATAGLHHPIRHLDSSMPVMMHGFLNLFGAGILSHVHCLDAATMQAILDDEAVDNFHFTNDAFAWNDYVANVDEIRAVRRDALISFGSCSFEEPYQDLQAMGLM